MKIPVSKATRNAIARNVRRSEIEEANAAKVAEIRPSAAVKASRSALALTDTVRTIADREFLFSYHFGGKTWGTSVFAADEAEAREKIKAVGMARYDGELMMRIPATLPGAGWITRSLCWWRNRHAAVSP